MRRGTIRLPRAAANAGSPVEILDMQDHVRGVLFDAFEQRGYEVAEVSLSRDRAAPKPGVTWTAIVRLRHGSELDVSCTVVERRWRRLAVAWVAETIDDRERVGALHGPSASG
jgi:hypothetical protein